VSQGNGNNEQLIARYGYDPFNRRIWKEQFGDKAGQALTQAKRTYFLYSDEGLLAEEEQDITLNGDGSTTTSGQPILTTQYGQKPDSLFTTGILFVKTKNSNNEDTIAYYHHDHLNTPIQATDKQGNVVWSANFNAFGRVTITTSAPTPEHPVIVSNLRFPGQYEDNETGLYYNWNRHYEPEAGSYITRDPIGIKGGINVYTYTKGNPLIYTDPQGLLVGSIGAGGGFHFLFVGGVLESGIIVGLDGSVCFYSQRCWSIGLGLSANLSGSVGGQTGGKLCDGSQESHSIFVNLGPLGGQITRSDSDWGIAKGMGGVGVGASIGRAYCTVTYVCIKESPSCKDQCP
jgi:RHS repeat-associated protein